MREMVQQTNDNFVIASEAKQSILGPRKLDCFVAALLAMTGRDDSGGALTC